MTRTAPTSRIRRSIRGFSTALDHVASVVTVFALFVLVGAVMLQVVARYVFQSPPSWTEELARYAMIWAGLVGATMSFKRRFDPALFNSSSTGPIWLAVLAAIARSGVVLAYLLPVIWFCFFGPGGNLARSFLTRHSRTMTDGLGFSTFWVAIAVPTMCLVILVHLVARWCGDRPAENPAENPADDPADDPTNDMPPSPTDQSRSA